MKKFLIAGSGLAAVAAAGSAGAVDVTLGGSIEMGIEYGLGKKVDGFMFDGSKAYQSISLNIAAAGTTDAGMKFGGKFALSTADELKLNLYDTNGDAADGAKKLVKLVNSENAAGLKANVINRSGGKYLSSGAVVSVKINSSWQAAKTKITGWTDETFDIEKDSAICKIGGRAVAGLAAAGDFIRQTGANAWDQPTDPVAGGYLPAGQLDHVNNTDVVVAEVLTVNGIVLGYDEADGDADHDGDDLFVVGIKQGTGAVDGNKTYGGAVPDVALGGGWDDDDDVVVDNAKVFAGPNLTVKMTSSTTKYVFGVACVTNDVKASSTKAYLDLASKVMQVGAASIYIEGGFGKLTLQQGDYAGKVSAIGEAGDQATISSTGLVAVLEGASLMGMNGYAAVDVGSIKAGSRPNYMLGTNVDLMGLSIAVEMEDEATTRTFKDTDGKESKENKYIDHWDMGTSYTLGDMQIDGVLDSAGDWALKAAGSVGGFTATSVIENVKKGKNKKAGLSIDTTLATTFNGMKVSIGLDEDMDYSVSGSYTIGNSGLALSASYSSGDNGGKVSAKLSF